MFNKDGQKLLLLLRHAKSSCKDLNLQDHDRPLNKRGKKDGLEMGKVLKDLGIKPDLIISSTAKRAVDTAKLVAKNCGYDKEIETNSNLYVSAVDDYIDVICSTDDKYQKILVIGHNPVIEDLIQRLFTKREIMPTCTLVQMILNIRSWNLLDKINYRDVNLIRIIRPKDIDTQE
ncbi:MAG: SixA phosphatase family protein [Candidatus Nitrosocosmicus sp.]